MTRRNLDKLIQPVGTQEAIDYCMDQLKEQDDEINNILTGLRTIVETRAVLLTALEQDPNDLDLTPDCMRVLVPNIGRPPEGCTHPHTYVAHPLKIPNSRVTVEYGIRTVGGADSRNRIRESARHIMTIENRAIHDRMVANVSAEFGGINHMSLALRVLDLPETPDVTDAEITNALGTLKRAAKRRRVTVTEVVQNVWNYNG